MEYARIRYRFFFQFYFSHLTFFLDWKIKKRLECSEPYAKKTDFFFTHSIFLKSSETYTK